ncbi:MAG: hypothetical protein ACJAXY_000050 [Nonlabens sp.]
MIPLIPYHLSIKYVAKYENSTPKNKGILKKENFLYYLNYTAFRNCILFFILFSFCEKDVVLIKTTLTRAVYGVVKDCNREVPFQNYKVIIKERQPYCGR